MPNPSEGAGPGSSSVGGRDRRVERAVEVALDRLFSPEPDPTGAYPDERVDIEGYAVAPDRTITLAVVALSPGALDMLDSAWSVLRRKGVGRRRMVVLDDRGRTVYVMTLAVDASDATLQTLRTIVVVPVHARGGSAEVHFLATVEEASDWEQRLGAAHPRVSETSDAGEPRPKEVDPLRPEDWAFLGLLSSVGAFDSTEGVPPEAVAGLLGMDAEAFADRTEAVEQGLEGLVSGLFTPPRSAPSLDGAPTADRGNP